MIADLLAEIPNLPNVWGEGALFAFSGLDGETNTRSGFVASFAAQPYGLLFHTPTRRQIVVDLPAPAHVLAATGDLLVVDTPSGEFVVTFTAWHSLVGQVPEGAQLSLSDEKGHLARKFDGGWLSSDLIHRDALVLLEQEGRFSLSYGHSLAEARTRAAAALAVDLPLTISRRLDFLRCLPALADPLRDRLLKKCASVMKVNTLAAESKILQTWSTPDRVPHQHMWLWDSVFHSLALNTIDPHRSWETLKSVLDAQRPDGMIPHMITVNGHTSRITQPPILAWGIWRNFQALHDREALAYALPRLERYLAWDSAHRDRNKNGLLEWFIEGDVNCRSGESGLDNSPRFDDAVLLDAVDFSTFAALDMSYLGRIAAELGHADQAALWQSRADALSQQIHQSLWDTADGFYYDKTLDDHFVRIRAVTGFLPLLLADIPEAHVERLLRALNDPNHFKTVFPIPSVSVSHPAWSTDMWRGATWINLNYLIAQGLRLHGRQVEADRLAEQTIAFVNQYYQQYGVLFEFFDAQDQRPPLACDRKGPRVEPYNIRRKSDSIRDYHWTAALTYCLLLEMEQRKSA